MKKNCCSYSDREEQQFFLLLYFQINVELYHKMSDEIN